jgi:hypothetical protein
MTHTTERCYDVTGGVLKLSLKTDHPLNANEYEALDRVAENYLGCFEKLRRDRLDLDDDDDRAVYELGGEENVTAG